MDEPKPITVAITSTISARLTQGRKICPIASREVCTTCMRGRKPSWIAWRVTVNAPEITACEAITVARVARPIIGYKAQSGTAW